MGTRKAVAALAVLILVAVASVAAYRIYLSPGGQSITCQPVKGGGILRSQLSATTFGALKEYHLPAPNRWANAITTAQDGSVWLAEQELPGLAHLFPGNGTIVEYAWPGYQSPRPPDCVPSVNISGIALWGGRIWAADEYENKTVGLNPSDGSVVSIVSSGKAPFPYWLAVGPDGNLWFTSNNLAGEPPRLGRILPDMTLQAINLVGLGGDQPLQLDFVNSTLALLSTLNQASNATTHTCVCTGHVYSFDPRFSGTTLTPAIVGEGYTLRLPTSVSYSGGSVWVAQHGASSVVGYRFSTGAWTKYPTSTVPWIDVTLPLVVDAAGETIWFNEHYANKIAVLDPSAGMLTEYSESNPAPISYKGIQNDLSIASAPGGLWFTSLSGNYVGFADGKADPGFHISATGSNTATLSPGGDSTFLLSVTGAWSVPLRVNVSDSENPQSTPRSIRISPGASLIQPGAATNSLQVTVKVDAATPPGDYTVAVTVGNELVQQTAYLFIIVK